MPHGAKRLSLTACLVIGLACALVLEPAAVLAAPVVQTQSKPAGITISPTQKDLTLSSGLLEAHSTVVLSNNTAAAVDVTMTVRDLTQIYDKGDQSFGQAGLPVGKYGLANWAVLPDGGNLTLSAGETKTVPITIQNRADLSPGGHYGAIVTSLKNSKGTGANPVSVQQNILSFLFVQKLGGAKLGMTLQKFTVNAQKTIPDDVLLSFKSTGNVYVVPRGYISVYSPNGALVAKGIINPESALVLPSTTRAFNTVLLPTTHKKNASGKYKIIAYYRYDGRTNFETATRYIDATNHTSYLTVAAILTGVIGIGLLFGAQRKFKRRSGLS